MSLHSNKLHCTKRLDSTKDSALNETLHYTVLNSVKHFTQLKTPILILGQDTITSQPPNRKKLHFPLTTHLFSEQQTVRWCIVACVCVCGACSSGWILSINDSRGAIDECFCGVKRKWYRGTRFGYHADSGSHWGGSQHGVDLPDTEQTHTWHTWQRWLSQCPNAIGIWVPLEPREDWRGVFHRQLEGEKRKEWRRGKSVEKRKVWQVRQGTERRRDGVC